MILANLATGLYRNKHALRLASKTYTVPDPVPGNGALKEWREKRRFTTEDRDPVSLPQRNVQILWQI